MVKCVQAEKKNAEATRRKLADMGLLDNSYSPARDGKCVYFAVKKSALDFFRSGTSGASSTLIKGKPADMKLVQRKLERRQEHGKPLREELAGKLTSGEMEELVGSFDILGDIAVLDIPQNLAGKERIIADAILKNHRNVKVVAKKIAGTGGQFRIRPVVVIAGENRTTTVCTEAGCEFELDLNEVYFSSRLEAERTRIAALVKNGEKVLIPFAGVGPYAIRIAEKVPTAKVMGIDLNHAAVEFFWRNIERNGTHNVIAMKGDALHVLPHEFRGWADRLIMPHPTEAEKFLEHAIPCIKKGGMLHYYTFGNAENPFGKAEREVMDVAKRLGRKAEVVFRRIARPYSKETVQIVLDATIE